MTPAITAGGPARLAAESRLALASDEAIRIEYGSSEWAGPAYNVAVVPARLTAVITATDEGFAAVCPELNSLGYGADEKSALADLKEAVRDYLSVLVEKDLKLAPDVAHHALYLPLLDVPETAWFAAVMAPSE